MQGLIAISAGVGLVSGTAAAIVAYALVGVLSWRVTLCASLGLAGVDGVVAARVLAHQSGWLLPAVLYFCAMGTALTIIDIASHRLPDAVTGPSGVVLAVLLTVAAAGTDDWSALARAGLGAAALFGGYFLLAFCYPPGMGFGDVKLAGLVGAVTGYVSWASVADATLIGFGAGAVAGLAVLLSRRGSRRSNLPFGPFMVAGAVLAIALGPAAGQ